MIYFIGREFADKHYKQIIENVESEITIDSLYLDVNNIDSIILGKNNIIVINEELKNTKEIINLSHKNALIRIALNNDKGIEEISYEIITKIEQNINPDYSILTKLYDFMQDRVNYDIHEQIFNKYLKPGDSFLELGAGTGNVTELLVKYQQKVLATDISAVALKQLTKKFPTVETKIIDINDIKIKQKFNRCGMFLDTLNYIEPQNILNVFKKIHEILLDDGLFIFDIHDLKKLEDFDGYIEELEFEEFFFNWLSYKVGEYEIVHRFLFVNNEIKIEEHRQYIYPFEFYKEQFKDLFDLKYVKEVKNRIIVVLQKKN